jgi:hypothetical protein
MDIDGRRHSWEKPLTPALHTKNKCGTNGAPILDIPENATTIEIVLNNLSPTGNYLSLLVILFFSVYGLLLLTIITHTHTHTLPSQHMLFTCTVCYFNGVM